MMMKILFKQILWVRTIVTVLIYNEDKLFSNSFELKEKCQLVLDFFLKNQLLKSISLI